jgi:hypothetical protein
MSLNRSIVLSLICGALVAPSIADATPLAGNAALSIAVAPSAPMVNGKTANLTVRVTNQSAGTFYGGTSVGMGLTVVYWPGASVLPAQVVSVTRVSNHSKVAYAGLNHWLMGDLASSSAEMYTFKVLIPRKTHGLVRFRAGVYSLLGSNEMLLAGSSPRAVFVN